jgi:hypothetical protein
MKNLQFNLTDGAADQFKNCFRFSKMFLTAMLLRKYRNQSLHSYIFHYNDIPDALTLVYFKFYHELEPELKFLRGFLFIEQIIFFQNQLFSESL